MSVEWMYENFELVFTELYPVFKEYSSFRLLGISLKGEVTSLRAKMWM